MKSIRYTLGLDIGITSIGWAVLQNNIHGEPVKIERLGVRIFDRAEIPKTGASLAAPRREARGARRVVRRRRHRKERIKHLIDTSGLMPYRDIVRLFQSGDFADSVYKLRVDALERKLTQEEAVRLLIHFSQRRGYRSNSKSQEVSDQKESGQVKQAISINKARMEEMGYRTVGEMLWKDERFRSQNPDSSTVFTVHNKPDDYKVTVERRMLRQELELIFACQREFGADWATDFFEEQYLAIWGSQRNFDEGPGGNSKYGGSQIEKMLGKCTFEPNELRAPKGSYTAEYARVLQEANHFRIVGHGMPPEPLTEEQRQVFIEYAFSSASANYKQLRKKLELPDDYFFNHLHYGRDDIDKVEGKKLGLMSFYHKLRTALNKVEKNAISQFSQEELDEIARILTLYKSDDNRRTKLTEAGIPVRFHDCLLELSTSKAARLSLKALRKLIPYLERGETYDKACKAVYSSHSGHTQDSRAAKLHLADAGTITNPVVRRAVSQSIKVINAIVREYGPPEVVRVELAREMGKPKEVRDRIEKQQKKNWEDNEVVRRQIEEYKGDTPTGLDIVKFKLFREQNGTCLYSGKNLDISRLFEAGYVDVDHIIPYSISFDDSYNNKVLVLASENRQKGKRIPYDYFGQDEVRWNRFETLVHTQIRDYRKRKNLLARKLPDEKEFKQRHLKDTQYLSRVVYNLINDHMVFAETGNYDRKSRVFSVNGAPRSSTSCECQ